jgi:anti-sigma regulatory factor (Ser/Thr protein kinase)
VAGALRDLTPGAESSVHPSCARCCSRRPSGPGRAGEAGGLMSEAVVPQSLTILAAPEQVRLARAFVTGALGGSHPCAFEAALLASELVTNSVEHSGSAGAGGTVTVTVAAGDEVVRVEVTDRSGDGVPVLLLAAEAADGEAEGGRGLRLVDMLSARWGYQRGGGLATTWFELRDLLQRMRHSAVSGIEREFA